jgi:Fungal specific transcription factor domain
LCFWTCLNEFLYFVLGCRKGGRECIYPEPSATSKSSTGNLEVDEGRRSNRERSSSSEDESGDDAEGHPEALLEDKELIGEAQSPETETKSTKHDISDHFQLESQSPNRRRRLDRTISESSVLTEKSPSPSTEGPIVRSGSYLSSSSPRTLMSAPTNLPSSDIGGDGAAEWSHLDNELQFYLNHHRNNLTPHHYFMTHDPQDFLRTSFLDMAVKSEPLLYAVVGFSAFHYTIALSNGRIQDFLTYYNKSVSLLRLSLRKSQNHTPSTLLTILQLASIEVCQDSVVSMLSTNDRHRSILGTGPIC